MQIIETHIAPTLEKTIRFQEYGVGVFKSLPTKSGFKKAIKKELIFIDGMLATTSRFISGGEKIELFKKENVSIHRKFKLHLEVLFEDDFLAIIYKPAGILVSGNAFATIDNALVQNLKKSNKFDAVRPRPVHRLDYATSGVLLVGKTSSSIISLNKLFEYTKITKTYVAITIGNMKISGEIDLLVETKKATTNYEVLASVSSKRFEYLNLVKLQPQTGRKHQLRKHLTAIGNPILGDKVYFKDGLILNGKGLYLHASTLEFTHPFTNEKMTISTDFPKKFTNIFSDF